MTVLMAGGGANLDFLKDALSEPFVVRGFKVPVRLEVARDRPNVNYWGAQRTRMAVALGGAVAADRWPKEIVPKHASLGQPAHRV